MGDRHVSKVDALSFFLNAVEAGGSMISADETDGLDPANIQLLEKLGLLRPAAYATSIVCRCELGHDSEVVWIERSGSGAEAFAPCLAGGRVQVAPERLRQWRLSKEEFARLLALAFGEPASEELLPGALWRVTTLWADGREIEVLLGLGASRRGGREVAERATERARRRGSVLLVPAAAGLPLQRGESASQFVVRAIEDVVSLTSLGVEIDRSRLMPSTIPRDSRPAVESFGLPQGANLRDVEVVVDDHDLTVSYAGHGRRYGFQAAGFEERRAREKPNAAWALLHRFAKTRGRLGIDKIRGDPSRQAIVVLRRALKTLLGTSNALITHAGDNYETTFRIRSAGHLFFPDPPPGRNWHDVILERVSETDLRVSVGDRAEIYRLNEFGPHPARAIGRLFASRGRVPADEHDDDLQMAELNKVLSDLLPDISGEPFEIVEKPCQWRANFRLRFRGSGNR